MDWETVIKTVGVSGILIAVIGFVLRSLFKQLLSLDMANHQHEFEKETMRFQTALNQTAFEHQTRFSALHEKRAIVIADLYSRLTKATSQAGILLVESSIDGYVPSQADAFKNAFDSYNSLWEYFIPNKIWFSRETCEKISHFSTELHTAISRMNIDAIRVEGGKPNPDARKNAWEKLEGEIPSLKAAIEREFRDILGISKEKAE
jgi:hypothetical protein